MKSQKTSFYKCLAIVAIILFCDQFLKVYIKLNFPLTIYGQDPIFDLGWFKLLFIENKGMAWGAQISDFIPFISEENGKLFLTHLESLPLASYFTGLKKQLRIILVNYSVYPFH